MDPDAKALLLAREHYPHLTLEESRIARAWAVLHADEFDGMLFHQPLSKSHVHIVAFKGREVTLVEVMAVLDPSAVILIEFAALWIIENPETTVVHLVAIGHEASGSTRYILGEHAINVELFPRPAEPPTRAA
jgi:hypothetical protein